MQVIARGVFYPRNRLLILGVYGTAPKVTPVPRSKTRVERGSEVSPQVGALCVEWCGEEANASSSPVPEQEGFEPEGSGSNPDLSIGKVHRTQ